jgi:LPS sulfotransferase NodH
VAEALTARVRQPDRAYADRLQGVSFRPVFVMGSARAGTTVLYQALAQTGSFNYVSAYHLIRYDEFLDHHLRGTTSEAKRELAHLFRDLGIEDARFDGVSVHPDFPEEYGFHLGRLRFQLTRRSLPKFLELCRKVQLVSGNDKPLLLKNPWDYRRFLFIKEALPESRFVFIHREPVDVASSLLRSMRTLLRQKNEYHALLARFYSGMMESGVQRRLASWVFGSGLGAKIVARQFAATAGYFIDNVEKLGPQDYVSVRYEDFCARPRAVVSEILGFLGLHEEAPVDYERMVRKPRASIRDDAADLARRELRRLNLKPYAARCGYDW